jgi:hypothetical protein
MEYSALCNKAVSSIVIETERLISGGIVCSDFARHSTDSSMSGSETSIPWNDLVDLWRALSLFIFNVNNADRNILQSIETSRSTLLDIIHRQTPYVFTDFDKRHAVNTTPTFSGVVLPPYTFSNDTGNNSHYNDSLNYHCAKIIRELLLGYDSLVSVTCEELLHGFEADIVIRWKDADSVKTVYNIEIDGPTHDFVRKQRFCSLRDSYMNSVHSVRIVRIPYDSITRRFSNDELKQFLGGYLKKLNIGSLHAVKSPFF